MRNVLIFIAMAVGVMAGCELPADVGSSLPDAGADGGAVNADGGQTDAGPPTDHLAVWYGEHPSDPSNRLCLIFCENGRLFSGDRLCTDTTAGDFSSYLVHARDGGVVYVRGADAGGYDVHIESIAGTRGYFRFDLGLATATRAFDRQADTSQMCTDPSRVPR